MKKKYLLKPYILGEVPEIDITEQEYLSAQKCHKQNYEAFEIELAFDFVIKNYIEIEKYIAENLVLDMTNQISSVDSLREQQWGFMRVFSNWLSSVSFWHDLSKVRLKAICGRESLIEYDALHTELRKNEFSYDVIFHLRNYSQHGGFPITSSSKNGKWNEDFTELKFLANYYLSYDLIRPYFEIGQNRKLCADFRQKFFKYTDGQPLEIKSTIRQSLKFLSTSMDNFRFLMQEKVSSNEKFIIELLEKYSSLFPSTSTIGLSIIPVDDRNIITDKNEIVPVRDEFILKAQNLRKKNNKKSLSNMEKRIISNA